MFLHDIAKGRTEDHSVAGMSVARRLCPRLGLDERQTEGVVWLIEQHLVMSDTAQRRDLSDRRTIETFAEVVGTVERLDMLLVLTVCDIRAVGPGVWNGWKSELLRTLYLGDGEPASAASGRPSRARPPGGRRPRRAARRRSCRAGSAHDFDAYAARHQPPYWLKVDLRAQGPPRRHPQHVRDGGRPAPVVDYVTDAKRAASRSSP